jgi:hypothetical protein
MPLPQKFCQGYSNNIQLEELACSMAQSRNTLLGTAGERKSKGASSNILGQNTNVMAIEGESVCDLDHSCIDPSYHPENSLSLNMVLIPPILDVTGHIQVPVESTQASTTAEVEIRDYHDEWSNLSPAEFTMMDLVEEGKIEYDIHAHSESGKAGTGWTFSTDDLLEYHQLPITTKRTRSTTEVVSSLGYPNVISIRSEKSDELPVDSEDLEIDACISESDFIPSVSDPSEYLHLPEETINLSRGDITLTGGKIVLALDTFILNILKAESRNSASPLSCLSAMEWSAGYHPLVTDHAFTSLLDFSNTLKTLAIIFPLTIRDTAFLYAIHAPSTKYLLNDESRRRVMIELLKKDFEFVDYLSRLIEWELCPFNNLEYSFSFDSSAFPAHLVKDSVLHQDRLIERFGIPSCLSKFIRSRGTDFVIVLYIKALFSHEMACEFQSQVAALMWGFGISHSFATFICQQYHLNPDWN